MANGQSDIELPLIQTVQLDIHGDKWEIQYYQDYSEIFTSEELKNLLDPEVFFVKNSNRYHGHRQEVFWYNTPLLLAFFPSQKKILQASPRLSREMVLVKHLEHLEDQSPRAVAFKEYVSSIAALNTQHFPSTWERVTYRENLPAIHDNRIFNDQFNQQYKEIRQDLVQLINDYRPTFFETISDVGLKLSAEYALIRLHLLKFLAILPCLSHDTDGKEVKRLLLEELRRLDMNCQDARKKKLKGDSSALPIYLQFIFKILFFVFALIPSSILASVIRTAVQYMAKRFIAGEDIDDAKSGINQLKKTNRDATIDNLGELVVSSGEAEHYCQGVLEIIRGMSGHYEKGLRNDAGILRSHVSIKVSALCHDFRPHALEATYQKIAPRLKNILITAKKEQVFINIDAEHHHYRDTVFYVYKRVLLETPELQNWSDTGIVVQAYLRDAFQHLLEVINLAKSRNCRMPIRLVKGAYWDAETIEANAHNFEPPQFLNKEETDLHFRQMAWKTLENGNHLQLCLASHNFSDHSWVEALRASHFSNAPVIEHQCLHMTYEGLSHALANKGWPTRNYVPIGNLIVGMAYLVRRIMENSSQVGVLSMMRSHKNISSFSGPEEIHLQKMSNQQIKHDSSAEVIGALFNPVTPVRLYLADQRTRFNQKLNQVYSDIQQGKWKSPQSNAHKIYSSSNPDLLIGSIAWTPVQEINNKIETLQQSWSNSSWRKSATLRISTMLRARDLMVLHRDYLAGLIIYESGKTMTEALADVDEAIDFIYFYSLEEDRINEINPDIQSRGVVGVICPWNFPLAIPCGMAVSALLAGNAVALKSSEQTPLICEELVKLLHSAGVPTDLIIHLAGEGDVGAAIVNHPQTAAIVFTGSMPVGTAIYKAINWQIKDRTPKKAITEMGGKNAIIITNNAELDEAVSGALYSAFGHAGQKCSAASRIIVDHRLFHIFANRFAKAVKDLQVGAGTDPATYINPLITKEDQSRVRAQVKEAIAEATGASGKVWLDRTQEQSIGFCVGPAVIEVDRNLALSPKSYAQKELFAPVVHLIPYQGLEQAIEIFNSTAYALTGGIFSQSQDDIEFLVDKVECGNIYINRPITGARVSIEPFGGFKLSGTGPKAGGSHYVQAFHSCPITNPIQDPNLPEEGTSYITDLPQPSEKQLSERVQICSKLITSILTKFEALFEKLDEKQKQKLQNFQQVVARDLINFLQNPVSNHPTPGQINLNDHHLIKSRCLIVAADNSISFESLSTMLSALAIGQGIQIICTRASSYRQWDEIVKMAHRLGIERKNLDVCFCNKEQTLINLRKREYPIVFVDTLNAEKYALYAKECILVDEPRQMKLILSSFEKLPLTTWKDFWVNFVWVRTLAINIMRHGAPLDLQND